MSGPNDEHNPLAIANRCGDAALNAALPKPPTPDFAEIISTSAPLKEPDKPWWQG